MAVTFLLLTLLAQAAFLVVARETASAAAEAAARAAARVGASTADQEATLLERISASVPGAVDPRAEVRADEDWVVASVTFRWRPPGPDLLPVEVTVEATSPMVVPP